MNVENPYLLLLIPLLLGPVYLWTRAREPRPLAVKWKTALRGLLAAAAVLAFAGVSLQVKTARVLRVFLLDGSSSYSDAFPDAVDVVKRHASALEADDAAALVEFGRRARLRVPVSEKKAFLAALDSLEPSTDSSTDLRRGLDKALEVARSRGYAPEIVLLSDGAATAGDASLAARSAGTAGVPVYPVLVDPGVNDRIALTGVRLPASVLPTEKAVMKIQVTAPKKTPARLTVSLGEKLLIEKNVSLAAGSSRLRVPVPVDGAGFRIYEVALRPLDEPDPVPQNNRAHAVTRVQGKPLVLWLTALGEPTPASTMLKTSGAFDLRLAGPGAPGLDEAEVVVIENVPAARFPEGVMERTAALVRRGRGLVAIGGPSALGPGGWADTPLEQALPVECEPEERKPVNLALVVDASGSMAEEISSGTTKYQTAVLAALPLVDELAAGDSLAMITFNVEPSTLRALAPVNDPEAVKNDIRKNVLTRAPGGGTNIYPALEKALAELSKTEKGARHVILFSDGKSEDGAFDAEAFKNANTTVSVIATDDNPDVERLKAVAASTGGRFYLVADLARMLRDTFVRDLRGLPGTFFREGDVPVVRRDAEFTRGLSGFPRVRGLDLTAPKASATIEFATDRDEPILAHWRYGAGRSAAFTPGLGEWGRPYLEWNSAAAFLAALVTGVYPQSPDAPGRLDLSDEYDSLSARYFDSPENAAATRNLELRVVPPSGEIVTAPMLQDAPGEYAASAALEETGAHLVEVRENGNLLALGFLVKDAFEETRRLGLDRSALEEIATLARGRVLGSGDAPPARRVDSVYAKKDISLLFVLLVAIFFILDLAFESLRRIAPSRKKSA